MDQRNIHFWLKINEWDSELIHRSIAAGITGLYVPSGLTIEALQIPDVVVISDNSAADLVLGQDVCEVLLDIPTRITAVARHHGVIPTIVYSTDWRKFDFASLLEISGDLLQHSTTTEDAEQGVKAAALGGSGLVLESTCEETILYVGQRLRSITAALQKRMGS